MGKAAKTVPGLTFRLTIQGLLNGEPHEGTEAIIEWPQNICGTDWHDGHADLGVACAMRDVRRRIARRLNINLKENQ